MEYSEAERYILSFTDYEQTPGVAYTATTYDLRRMEELLHRLGDPHRAARTAHVAGTKGKGSTAAMIASALTATGYRTGLYTSPHFLTMRERIRVDGRMISEADFARAVDTLLPEVAAVNAVHQENALTTFEVLTAVAFTYFSSSAAAYQVLEVGLGGRLDATNVVLPDVAVITSISLDHTQVLGNTVAQIAGEKAGIIKPGGMVVSARQAEAAQEVLAAACARSGARLISVGKDVTWQLLDFDSRCQYVRVSGRRGTYDVCLPLLGEHQMENAACAVAALEVLALKGAAVSHEDIVRGISEVRWPGRLQVLRRRPWLVCDAAHNADSAAKLVKALRRYFAFEKAILVVGVSADKDVAGIVAALAPAFDEVLVTRSRHPRSAPPEMVASLFSRHGVRPSTCENAAGALQAALQLAGREDLVCVTGSLFLVGEVLASEKALPDAMPRK